MNKPSKTWTYTINNYTPEEEAQLKLMDVTMHRCCKEVGENGTVHLQGAIRFRRAYRLTALKKLFPRAHFEIAVTPDPQNYCTKGEVLIDKNDAQPGKRSDLLKAIDTMKANGMRQCALQHPEIFVKYHRGLKCLQEITVPTRDWYPTEVIVLWGPTGVGKSRRAREIDPGLYNVPEPVNGNLWFSGYVSQQTILFDDFYGWIRYHTMLQFLDGYPLNVEYKGGAVARNWTRVIITSNKPPDQWYPSVADQSALMRRLNSVIFMSPIVIPCPKFEENTVARGPLVDNIADEPEENLLL